MRTLQEKYNAVLEGKFSKEQFRRDAVMQLPNLVSKFNSFEDMTTILKNRGMLAEAKKEEVTAYKKPEVDPVDLIAPDLLDDGIRAELEAAGIEGTPSEEEYAKAKEKAAKNLAKDPLCYKNAQTMPEMGKKKALKEDTQNAFLKAQDKLRDELSDKEMTATVADEPAAIGAAFRKKVMSMADEFTGTPEEVQAKLLAAWEKFKEDYNVDREAEYRGQGAATKTFDDFEAGAFYEDKRVELEAEGIELSAEDMEELRTRGKFELPDGRVIHYLGKPANEGEDDVNVDDFEEKRTNTRDFAGPTQNADGTYNLPELKEAVKALIKKTLEA
jgi:hypothetical protein